MTLSIAANRTFAFVPALLSVSVFVLSAVCPDAAWAGTSTGGQEHFADLYAMLKAWSTGTLGKSIALMFLLVGFRCRRHPRIHHGCRGLRCRFHGFVHRPADH